MTTDSIRRWLPHATSEQRKDLATAVLDHDARLGMIETVMQGLATLADVDALRGHVARLNEAVPHAWVLFRTPRLDRAVFVDVFSMAEYARSAAEKDWKAPVHWGDPPEAVGQVGYVQEQGHRSNCQQPMYRIERRALRGA